MFKKVTVTFTHRALVATLAPALQVQVSNPQIDEEIASSGYRPPRNDMVLIYLFNVRYFI